MITLYVFLLATILYVPFNNIRPFQDTAAYALIFLPVCFRNFQFKNMFWLNFMGRNIEICLPLICTYNMLIEILMYSLFIINNSMYKMHVWSLRGNARGALAWLK